MYWVPLLILSLFGGVFLFVSVDEFRTATRRPGSHRVTGMLGSALVVVGAVGFFGAAVAASGGMNWLPAGVELPAGRVDGVVTLDDGVHVVPLEHAGRIQLYDADWRFLRGWQLDAGGGIFVLDGLADGNIEVLTSRLQRRYVFDRDGRLLSTGASDSKRFDRLMQRHGAVVVPTHPLLWAWSGPFLSLLAILVGFLLVNHSRTRRHARQRP